MYWLIPDWSTLLPTAIPGNAQVMCALDFTLPASSVCQAACPRHTLARVLQHAQQTWALNFLVSFEVELVVMIANPITGKMDKCSQGLGMLGMSGLRHPCYQYVEQCVTQLEARGVNLQAIHTEGFRGQYKFALAPLPPPQAVDLLLLVHGYLKDIFSRQGYMVTVSPKPVASDPLANGQHTHISLQPCWMRILAPSPR